MASLGQDIKILPNAGQELGKGLDEPLAHTHQIQEPQIYFESRRAD